MSRAISYEMKKAPKKPRAPKPKATRQKQKQSVNVKIHINNSRPARRAPAAASRSLASPFPQPISSYPIFRDVLPPPPIHYNPVPVAQPALVAHGFHGIPPATARVRRSPPPSHAPLVSSGYASDLSDITSASSRPSMSSSRSAPHSTVRRAPQRIVIGSGDTSDASKSTTSAMSGVGSINNSGASVVSLGSPSVLSVRARVRRIQENIRREDAERQAGTLAPIFAGYGPTPAERRAERLRTGASGINLNQLSTHITPASPLSIRYDTIYPPEISHFHASPFGRSHPSSRSSEKGSKR